MSHEFQRRATHFFKLWFDQCDSESPWLFEDTPAILAGYSSSLEYLTWAVEVPLASRTYKCVTDLVHLFPRARALGL